MIKPEGQETFSLVGVRTEGVVQASDGTVQVDCKPQIRGLVGIFLTLNGKPVQKLEPVITLQKRLKIK